MRLPTFLSWLLEKIRSNPKRESGRICALPPKESQLKKRTTLLWIDHSLIENDNVDSSSDGGSDGGD